MNLSRLCITAVLLGFAACNASAWTCPAGQHHVQSTKGTPGAVLVEGEYFVCVSDTPPPTVGQPQTQSQNQNQNQNQNQTASGGSATATTGSSVSNSASNSSLKNSGNSSNTNSNTANGGTGGNSVSTASATNNGNGSNNSSYNSQTKVDAAAATAFSNASPTAPCVIGYGVGGQLVGGGLSLSGGKVDKNCAILETARSAAAYSNRLTYCKVYITDKFAKKAGVTLEDCLQRDPVPVVPVQVAPPVAPVPVSVTVVPIPVSAPPVQQQTALLRDFGYCPFFNGNPSNVCYRLLDSAVLAIQANPNTKIFLTGPVETVKLLPYLKSRVSATRIGLQNFTDEDKISVQVFGTE